MSSALDSSSFGIVQIPIVQNSTRSIPANPYLNYESDDDHPPGLPEAFVGQDVEDLAYGANLAVEDHRMKSPRGGGSAWWSEEEDEEVSTASPDTWCHPDGLQMLISQLSDSEVGQKSQSSVHNSDSDDPMTDTDDASSTNDELDGFGFPSHTASAFPSSVDVPSNSPLVLMENWDGQFILVQPRQGRSRSRPRGSRGSRMAGSIGESTVLSTLDQQGLIIDPDAAEYEFDEDSSSSLWSGMSDEGDGDTTDSMEEEDMPVLDSPALQGVLEQQMADITMGIAVNGSSGLDLQQATSFVEPSIVVTDISVPQTRALSTAPMSMSDTSTGLLAIPVIPAPPAPMMGTFHPTSDDPAQHAVIDGSKTTTKSPFTHRRRSRRDSLSSIVTGKERKRKSSSIEAFPFSPATPASSILPKRARYSSIPGHPRYVAARRAAEALDNDGETTPSEYETGAMVLEDMLEISMLGHEFEEANDPDFRFDRVPVSTYLRRNFHSSSGRRGQEMPAYPCMKSGSINDALAGPPGRMLVSPMLPPVVEGEEGMLSRKERRRKARRGRMAPLQI